MLWKDKLQAIMKNKHISSLLSRQVNYLFNLLLNKKLNFKDYKKINKHSSENNIKELKCKRKVRDSIDLIAK